MHYVGGVSPGPSNISRLVQSDKSKRLDWPYKNTFTYIELRARL